MKTTLAVYDKEGKCYLIDIKANWGRIRAKMRSEDVEIENNPTPFFDGMDKIRITLH